MTKEKRILSYTISYLLIGLFICLIGISNVFAATYTPANYKAQLYDNINGSLSAKDTSLESTEFYYGFIGLTAYTSGGAWGISSPIPLIANHTYSMTVDPYVPGCGFTILSTVNRIGVGTSLSNAKSSYENNTNVTEKFSQAVSNSKYLQYVFTPSINASYIVFPYATTSTCSSTTNQLSNIVIEDLGEGSISQDQINTSLNNQTNEIQTSIDNSTNTITGAIDETENNINSNIDDMEQAIVDSNKETQEVIKDQFNDCKKYEVNLSIDDIVINNKYLNSSGEEVNSNQWGITDYINIYGGYTYTLTSNFTANSASIVFYDKNKNIINAITYSNNTDISFTTDDNVAYFRLTIRNSGEPSSIIVSSTEICTNKLDEANETSKSILGKIGDLISYINPFSENFFVYKLIELLIDMLKTLFIPKDGYFEDWFNTLKIFFEEKLGFLATPFTIIIDFINRYLELDSGADIIINIPDITVPNFENHVIISATSFNWSELLKSKDSLNTLWQLYLSFIDVFLILNFINLCENKYNRIFGGDTTQYEYYTVEDSYNIDVNTGEVKNMRRNERKTTRKKAS